MTSGLLHYGWRFAHGRGEVVGVLGSFCLGLGIANVRLYSNN